ncbi:MAG: 30S ribosomal protein S13, partial [bacterium]|nr:30S ribosomal protein S13 [bacterium]
MPRISGIDIPAKKRIEVALTYIFGIGRQTSSKILEEVGVDPNLRAETL